MGVLSLLLLLPAADHAYIIFHDPACSACVRYRAVVRALDWLRRLRWVPLQGVGHVPGVTQQAPRTAIYALGPDGRIRMGYEAGFGSRNSMGFGMAEAARVR